VSGKLATAPPSRRLFDIIQLPRTAGGRLTAAALAAELDIGIATPSWPHCVQCDPAPCVRMAAWSGNDGTCSAR